ncbi:Hsp20/alpha crystallin family protein [Kitasatospora purpeofusca]|uniref:Hsp20/alpha crystallin family protein n=1 Tax=Kitasatospora purpeofusca TaxID=67352 RepID=UPI0035D7806A
MRTDSLRGLRDLDRPAQQPVGTVSQSSGMPLVACRDGEMFVLRLDLPGIAPKTVDLDVERNGRRNVGLLGGAGRQAARDTFVPVAHRRPASRGAQTSSPTDTGKSVPAGVDIAAHRG